MPLDPGIASIGAQQDAFARALLWRDDSIPRALTAPSGRATERRFGVYRNNVFASLTSCLAARFPVVERLVGEEFFAAMARVFVGSHPPTSPALIEYGEEFSSFLETFEPAQVIPYLSDVARLEWLMAVAYHAADARPIDAAHLGTLGEAAAEARLRLHPSSALLISRYPIISIWETNARDEIVKPIDASLGGEAALIVRPQFDVVTVRIDTATYGFIAAIGAGHALEIATDIGIELDTGFNVAAALQLLFASEAVIGAEMPRPLPATPAHTTRMMSCAI